MIRIELNNFFDKPLLGFMDFETCEMIRNKYNIDNSLDVVELVIRKPIFGIHEDFFINLLRVRSIEYPSIEAFKDSVTVDVENSITIEKTFKTAMKKLIKARKQFDLSLPKENIINVRSQCIQ